jgi:hypothetical protein
MADTRKYTLAASQTYEAIEASANWLNRDQKDVEQVSSSDLLPLDLKLIPSVVEGQQVPGSRWSRGRSRQAVPRREGIIKDRSVAHANNQVGYICSVRNADPRHMQIIRQPKQDISKFSSSKQLVHGELHQYPSNLARMLLLTCATYPRSNKHSK